MQYSERFKQCFAQILIDEGGWVFTDDKNDPGGMTYGGMTLHTLNTWLQHHMTKAPFTINDFQLSANAHGNKFMQELITECYWFEFWMRGSCDAMPEPLDELVFSMGVNIGPQIALKLIQKAALVKEDGIWGPITDAAVYAAIDSYVNFEMMVINEWEDKYLDLVVENAEAWYKYALAMEKYINKSDMSLDAETLRPKTFRAKYLRGWINRTREYEERYIS